MTLAKFFEDVAAGIGLGPPVDRTAIAELRADLDARLTEIAAPLPHGAASIVLTKARIRSVLACETGALATEATDQEMTAGLMLGHLLDRVVAAYVVTGSVPPDPFECAVESLRAERDERALAWLESSSQDALDELGSELVERAARVRDSWPSVEGTWWPRPEDRVSIPLAGGRVRLVGRFDLLLGGAPTPVERVIVELKAGTATAVHQPDLYWYGLLSALRDGVVPRAVAVWSAADGMTTAAPLGAGSLESAALRVEAAAARWVELNRGRPPTITAYPGCRWCPVLASCDTGKAWTPDD